ncbi:hypothetical protein [Streptomyces sp. NPDC016845]|uniref:hypothetical protein n=1 Tax=Streptomyces sp. NPDC016845 TaxID=3364972 RepID=UPI0037ABCE5E
MSLDRSPVAAPGRLSPTGPASSATVPAPPHHPAPLVHRTLPAEPTTPSTAPRPHQPATRADRPAIDMDALSRDLWRRFTKQMRIEQERRGRG